MQIGSSQWLELVVQGADQVGLAITSEHAAQFAQHAVTLLEWNRKINLTAIVEPRQVAIKHFLDAIAPLAHIPPKGQLLDIGTGGGFPGIPLKILRPEQPMTLIDGSRKKINFVKHIIRQLGLQKIEALQTRAEDLGHKETHQGRYAVIVCRALADLATIARTAGPLLCPDGRIVIYQGPAEHHHSVLTNYNGHKGFSFKVESISYGLPILGDRRTLVVLQARS